MKKEEIIKKWKDSGLLDNLTEMECSITANGWVHM